EQHNQTVALGEGPSDAWRTFGALAWYALIFIVMMTLFPKKFNRYIEPIFPALDIMAAAGLVASARWIGALIVRPGWASHDWARRLAGGLLSIVALTAVLNAAWWHPYGIAAFNQALGGAQAGAQTFLIGWGEGFEQVADWLNQQPDL